MDKEDLTKFLRKAEDQFFDRVEWADKKDRSSFGEKIAGFATSQGGVLLVGQSNDKKAIGVGEPSEFIHGLGEVLQNLEPAPTIEGPFFFEVDGKNLALLKIVSLGQGGPCSFKGVAFKRLQDSVVKIPPRELYRIWSLSGRLHFEERESSAPVTAIDQNSLELLSQKAREKGLVKQEAFLQSRRLSSAKSNYLTNLGVIVLAVKPSDWLSNARIHIVRFKGVTPGERTASTTLSLPLAKLVNAATEFVKTFLPTHERIEGIQRIDEPAIPEFVLREAIVNAIAHRDYENPGEVLIRIFDDRLEVLNPGAPTPEEWKKILDSAIPLHRNPRIYEFLRETNLGEGVGQGIPEIKRRLKQAGAGDAVFSIIRDSFNLALYYKKTKTNSLDELVQKALEIGLRQKKVSSTQASKELGVSLPVTLRILNELVKQGFAVHKGGGRTSHYEFKDLDS